MLQALYKEMKNLEVELDGCLSLDSMVIIYKIIMLYTHEEFISEFKEFEKQRL